MAQNHHPPHTHTPFESRNSTRHRRARNAPKSTHLPVSVHLRFLVPLSQAWGLYLNLCPEAAALRFLSSCLPNIVPPPPPSSPSRVTLAFCAGTGIIVSVQRGEPRLCLKSMHSARRDILFVVTCYLPFLWGQWRVGRGRRRGRTRRLG